MNLIVQQMSEYFFTEHDMCGAQYVDDMCLYYIGPWFRGRYFTHSLGMTHVICLPSLKSSWESVKKARNSYQ